jgi:uracil-DNA glycosylase family 4
MPKASPASAVAVPAGTHPSGAATPGPDCPLCPRLKDFRDLWRQREPGWFNAPVPSFGPVAARLAIVGLAPGLQGANRTGRPFTGDYAGVLLYETLAAYGFTRGTYAAHIGDGLELVDARIVNAVRCVPPENKPTGPEITTCRNFLAPALAEMPNLRAIVTLGRIAHDSTVSALKQRRAALPFLHGTAHDTTQVVTTQVVTDAVRPLRVFVSYHCSRYNTNTRVLTPEMFRGVFASVRAYLDGD